MDCLADWKLKLGFNPRKLAFYPNGIDWDRSQMTACHKKFTAGYCPGTCFLLEKKQDSEISKHLNSTDHEKKSGVQKQLRNKLT